MSRQIFIIVVDEEQRKKPRLSELKIFPTRHKHYTQLIESALRKAKQEPPIAELRSVKQCEKSNNR